MTNSGDAAEQMIRMSLDGVEMIAKIAGSGAKNIAAFLLALAKENQKEKSPIKLMGKENIKKMLKSGKKLVIFPIKEKDLDKFESEAKRYGVTYCRTSTHDGICDMMVTEDDAPQINRIAENLKYAAVDTSTIQSEIENSKSNPKEKTEQDINDTDKLLDELLPDNDGKPLNNKEKTEGQMQENPEAAKTTKPRLSEPILKSNSKSAKGTSTEKPSIKEEIREIKVAQAKEEADKPKRDDKLVDNKPKPQRSNQHKQPQNNRKKSNFKKSKER